VIVLRVTASVLDSVHFGARPVRTLVTLGDSTSYGVGDPLPGGGWRGYGPLLAAALGAETLLNTSRTGARMRAVRAEQLPRAVAARPDVAVVFVGMNDTLRADFDPAGMLEDCLAVAAELRSAGAHVLLARYHDHTRVFPLPAPLRRALQRRIALLNEVTDAVAATDPEGVGVLDLATLPGGYERSAWAIDRLHPSELGHRLLAAGFARLADEAGFAVPAPVALVCAGGRVVTRTQRVAWLLFKGVPWLARRSGDLGPVIVQGLWGELVVARRRGAAVRALGSGAGEPAACQAAGRSDTAAAGASELAIASIASIRQS
jgi:lysophospholipase L1-like esterase